ncbi:MAG: DUF4432 family protein [Chloroflexota bacterium]
MTILHLTSSQFSEKESLLVEHGELKASTFRFPSGVCALRLENSLGELIVLPFQGQHIWDVSLRGRRLTMKSMFDQPYPTREFLATFGGFLQHCGATAMGSPGLHDTHPLHGELPNAPYESAYLEIGYEANSEYLVLGGLYRHARAFTANYLAEPHLKLFAASSRFRVGMKITNLKDTPMPLMYLVHVNFRPVDNGRLVYSALCDPEHMRVRTELPSHAPLQPGYAEFIQELAAHPEKHLVLQPGLAFDPEVVFFPAYQTDADGWAHAMQVHPDGSADYMRHRPAELNTGVRWICRTPDQDALGFEAGTAGVTGYTAERQKGAVSDLPGKAVFSCEYEIGVLTRAEAQQQEQSIRQITGWR